MIHQTHNIMSSTTKIILSNGTELINIYTVLETLARNGYTNAIIVFKGHGSCTSKDGDFLTFEYKD